MAVKLTVAAAYLALAFAVSGCRHAKPAPPPAEPVSNALDVTLIAAPWLNPDDRGESLPTLVRIYQLKSTGKLEAADFDQLYRQPRETLGEDLLQADELVLSPRETAHRHLERDRSARMLAVVPMVRCPAGLSWRTAVDLPPPDKRLELTFVVEGYRVERRPQGPLPDDERKGTP